MVVVCINSKYSLLPPFFGGIKMVGAMSKGIYLYETPHIFCFMAIYDIELGENTCHT
jgi:hypothetical protein